MRQYNYQFENFYATVIQQTYRNYKKRLESLAKQVWKVVRNNDTPDDMKFLGIKNESEQSKYICYRNERCYYPIKMIGCMRR